MKKIIMILGIFLLLNMGLVVSEEDVMKLAEKSADDSWDKSEHIDKDFDCSYKDKMTNYKSGVYAHKMEYGHKGAYGTFGYGILKLVYIAMGAFIISSIFWLTRNWLVKNKK